MSRFHWVRRCLGLAGSALLCASAVQADVTIKQHLSMDGGGLMKMMNMSGETATTISGDRARTQSNLEMESRLMRMFSGGPTAQIVRLDEGKVYQLNLKKKTYSELSLAEQKAQLEKSMQQMRDAQASQKQQSSGVDESDCQWSEPTASVKHTGETDTVAGARVERTVVTATQSCKDPKSDQVCDFNLILDQWLAPDWKASGEVQGYYAAYSKQLGLEVADSPGFSQRLESMFGGYQGIWHQIAEKMKEAKGYPLRSTVTLAVGGPKCDTSEQAQSAEASPGIGKAIGGAVGGAFGRFLGGRRDKAAEDAKKAEAPAAPTSPGDDVLPAGTVKLMSIRSELESVSREPAEAGAFDVPDGYRKVN